MVPKAEAEEEDFRFWYEELTPAQRVDMVAECLRSSSRQGASIGFPDFEEFIGALNARGDAGARTAVPRRATTGSLQHVMAPSQPVIARSQPVIARSQPVIARSQPVIAPSHLPGKALPRLHRPVSEANMTRFLPFRGPSSRVSVPLLLSMRRSPGSGPLPHDADDPRRPRWGTCRSSIVPFGREAVPSPPVIARSKSVIARSQRVIAPSQRVIARSQPVIARSQPVMAPSQPVIAPSQPVIAPSQPVMAPWQRVIAPSQPVIAPSQPVIAPIARQHGISSLASTSPHPTVCPTSRAATQAHPPPLLRSP